MRNLGHAKNAPWDVLPAWQDPPWILRGRVVTAWFEIPWELLVLLLNPALLPTYATHQRVRFRFYDLSFEAVSPNRRLSLAPERGLFREASFGVPASYNGSTGECSALLWTNSPVYLTWAREVFGWPVWLGEVDLSGDVWKSSDPASTSGQARLVDEWGSVTLSDLTVGSPKPVETGINGKANWFVPRRVPMYHTNDLTELLIVHPTVRSAGQAYDATGTLDFEFAGNHPLQALKRVNAQMQLQDKIELVIGDDVEVYVREPIPRIE